MSSNPTDPVGTATLEQALRLAVQKRQCGAVKEALQIYEQILAAAPEHLVARYNQGLALIAVSQFVEAARSFEIILQTDPSIGEAWFGLANVRRHQRRWADAVELYQNAVQRLPQHFESCFNLGNCQYELSCFTDAIVSYRRALELQPANAQVYCNLGNALREAGETDDAVNALQTALELEPELNEARINLALAAKANSDLSEAESWLREAVEKEPGNSTAWINLGNVLRDQERIEEAQAAYSRLGDDAPFHARARFLWPLVVSSRNELEDRFKTTLGQISAWKPRGGTFEEAVESLVEPPWNLQFFHGNVRPWKEKYAQRVGAALRPWITPYVPPARREGSIHVGFIVTKGHEAIFVRSLADTLARIAVDDLNCSVFCHERNKLAVQQRMPHLRVHALPTAIPEIVDVVRSAKLDVAYFWEVGTDLTNYLLPFFRLAPVQCTSWGTQVTTGVPNVDYYLSSQWLEPAQADDHYSERLELSHSLFAYQNPVDAGPFVDQRRRYGIPERAHLYGCLQNIGKLHPDMDEAFQQLLNADPKAILVFNADRHGFATAQLERRLAATLGRAYARVLMLPWQKQEDYLSWIHACDVMLDPFYFDGCNSTYDAIALQRHVVTFPSNFQRGRFTTACYNRMGLSEYVAQSPTDFVHQALAHACNREFRDHTRSLIAQHSHHLFRDQSAPAELQRILIQLGEAGR